MHFEMDTKHDLDVLILHLNFLYNTHFLQVEHVWSSFELIYTCSVRKVDSFRNKTSYIIETLK